MVSLVIIRILNSPNMFKFSLLAVLGLVLAAPAYAEYEYISTSTNDIIYYGKKVDQVGDTAVIFVRWNDVVNAKKGEFSTAFKCSNGLVRNKDEPTGWLKVKKNTMNEDWMNFACRKNGLSLNNPM